MIDRIKNIRFGFREDYDPDKRIVKQDIIKIYNDEYFISTVDLGTNHSFIENYDEYFETMIFKNNDYNGIYERRYATREQALENHNLLVDNLNNESRVVENSIFLMTKY